MFRGSHKNTGWRAPTLLFVGVYLFSGLSPVGTSFDSRWTVYIAMSIWNHHDTNLDEYSGAIRGNDFYAVECVDAAGHVRIGPPLQCQGHWYNSYPVGDSVLAAPLIWAAVGLLTLAKPALAHISVSRPIVAAFLRGDYDGGHAVIEMEVASFLLAAAAVVMFAIARRYLSTTRSVMLALLFALATSAYSVGGRAIWQHTPSVLLLAITIYLLLRAEERPAFAAWAGLPVALSYTARPTDSLFVLIFTAYVAIRHRAYLVRFLVIAAPVAVVFVAYNYSVYRSILSPYYRPHLEGFLPGNWGKMSVALAGNLVSPGRGLLIYTPVFGFAIWSMLRTKWKTPLSKWLAALVLMHWLVVSAYIVNWWAGNSYGPRFFTDVTPVFVLFLIPYFARWETLSVWLRTTFVALALVGLAMHLRGGWSPAVYQWNAFPVNVDQHPERNWDWTDPPFLR